MEIMRKVKRPTKMTSQINLQETIGKAQIQGSNQQEGIQQTQLLCLQETIKPKMNTGMTERVIKLKRVQTSKRSESGRVK
jgi:hypothetical protein